MNGPRSNPPTTPFAGRWGRMLAVLGAMAVGAIGLQAVDISHGHDLPAATGQSPSPVAWVPGEVGDTVTLDQTQRQGIVVEPVLRQRIATVKDFPGRVAFDDDRVTPVFPIVSGRVVEVRARKGMVVATGTPLFVLDSADMASAQSDLVSARSDVAKARIGQHYAQLAATRAERLYAWSTIATKDLEQSQADLRRANDDVERARMALKTVEGRLELLGKAGPEIAALAHSEDHRVTIRAPIGGTIVDRKVGPGQLVKPDSPDPLVQIGDLRTVWVTADIFESDLESVHPGAPCAISVPAHPGTTYSATVDAISPTVDPSTRTLRLRCVVANPRMELLPDMFATVGLRVMTSGPVVALPLTAIITEGANSMVWLEEKPGSYRRQVVHPGPTVSDRVILEAGLDGGERVVVRGALQITELSKGTY